MTSAPPDAALQDELARKMRVFVCNEVFPKLIEQDAFLRMVTDPAVEKYKLTKPDALALVLDVTLAIAAGLAQAFGVDAHSEDFRVRFLGDGRVAAIARALKSGQIEDYLQKHWPDATPAGNRVQ